MFQFPHLQDGDNATRVIGVLGRSMLPLACLVLLYSGAMLTSTRQGNSKARQITWLRLFIDAPPRYVS